MCTKTFEYKIEKLDLLEVDNSWSFSDKTIKDTAYITHNYYTYPAKFIPQIASRLINMYSMPRDTIVDPFMGSATTMVESLVNGRKCVGVDINEIAYLVSRVKTTPIDIKLLKKEYSILENKLSTHDNAFFFDTNINNNKDIIEKARNIIPENDRIDYWFKEKQKEKLSIILYYILEIKNINIKDFFLISFAQILKSCSIWLQKSIKPTRDMNKKDTPPIQLFLVQSKKMIKRHELFCSMLDKDVISNIDKYINIKCLDSRYIPLKDEEADLIVTSPPYVTSYEYADLHQLPSLWFGYIDALPKFRQKFIGSSYKERDTIDLKSETAKNIINEFGKNKKSKEVQNYYADMLETFIEMRRVLKPKGKASIVIGNTQFMGVNILNAEVFLEQMNNIGFRTFNIIKREIPSKMLPSTRDSATGRFATINSTDKLVYPIEYILILEKI